MNSPTQFTSNPLRLLALLALASYAIMFFVLTGAAVHTVDSIRDFDVARAIAHGEQFPLVSQPFAARFQVPPAYFYLIAIPIFFGGNEFAVFYSIAALCFASILLLRWQLTRAAGANVGNIYALLACTFPTSLFMHSVANSSLAFAFSNIALAALIGFLRSTRGWDAVLLFATVLMALMHPSGIVIALILMAVVCFQWRKLSVLGVALWVMAIAAAMIWFRKFGWLAPEAEVALTISSSSDGLAKLLTQIVARVISPDHWPMVISTYREYALGLPDAPTWLARAVTVFAWVIVGSIIGAVLGLFFHANLVAKWIVAITVAVLLASIAYLSQWGVWYFDAAWPWIATSAALGLSWFAQYAMSSVPNAWRKLLVGGVFAVIALTNLLPQFWQHRRLEKYGEIWIEPASMFLPKLKAALPAIPVMSANTYFSYRDFLTKNNAACGNRVVGMYEWLVSDLNLRETRSRCNPGSASVATDRKMYLFGHQRIGGLPPREALREPVWQSGQQMLFELPTQRVSINGEPGGTIVGEQKIRYSAFRPAEIASGTQIKFDTALMEPGATVARIATRCLQSAASPLDQWRASAGRAEALRLVSQTQLLGLQYFEYEISLKTTNAVSLEITNVSALNCDVFAFHF